ncbi:acetyl-CoA carboxylase biotin carboxyl carrier protein subunit [Vagococcus carniphilus]|uniref:acetyl-CoA carboxylase biotin carboxyl carrier protein subunit n=1 Tax=Vagococcus carniphilus TaxID=218144 RepID=UPI00288EFEE8|nr:acetyl-CoA carboxylase biotin carboxyl carrier protein subunit [Vagococcus carniphilus]MDT2829327.1 acetyl-CoA carboxylase biotin carboxyl carrier protein subunit [Vagococcus carniphilus]MDT2838786.1 acetyl-CoA carboxylase biotin carboxyl carrier protein subunit [Vagococcus carniphilus]MDT2852844.1 acetyl-CoA carboxylase biotin carboxyl carrier protein subunit [Vagococcus carniphilus]
MLRKFKIRLEGEEYLVEMEEIGGAPVAAPAPVQQAAPVAAPVQEALAQEEAPVVSASPVAPGENTLDAPMPGTILKLLVNVGDTVTENQPLLILEAMKMENEIVTKKNGVVKAIHVPQGQVVNAGDALITVE